MLTRIEIGDLSRVSHMFRFDADLRYGAYVDWGNYMIQSPEQCYIAVNASKDSLKYSFFIPDVNFLMLMKLSCKDSASVEIRGHNYK